MNCTPVVAASHSLRGAIANCVLTLLACLPCMLTGTASAAQIAAAPSGTVEAGAPAYELISTESIGLESSPTDFREMPDGRMLLVAGVQLALGDGVRWQVYEQAGPERIPVTSAGVDRDGTIYVGMPEGVARVVFGADGYWRPQLVVAWSIPDQQDKFILPEAMMHEAGGQWLWHSLTGAILSWRPGQNMELRGFSNTIETIFEFNGSLYVSERSNGTLSRLQGGQSEPVKSEGSLSAITSTQSIAGGEMLVGTYGRGLQLFDGHAVRDFQADELFRDGERIDDMCRTDGGFIAAAVDGYGIIFFREDGQTVQVLDRLSDSRLARIRRLKNGRGGIVWALLDSGLLRVQFPSGVSSFEAQFGSGLTTAHPHRFGETLWMLVDGRLYRGIYDAAGRMVHMELDSPPGIFVTSFSSSIGVALAGTEQGAFLYGAGGWQPFAAGAPYMRIISSRSIDGLWPYTARNEVGWLRREGERLIVAERHEVPDLGNTFNKPVRDAAGDIWLELGIGRIARVQLTKHLTATIFTEKDGVPRSWPQLFLHDGVVMANMSDNFLRFDGGSQRFITDNSFLSELPGVRKIFGRPGIDPQGRLWIVADGELQIRRRDAKRWLTAATVPLNFSPYFLTFETDGVVWMHAQHHLARFDPHMPVVSPPQLAARFTEISVAEGRRHFFALKDPLPPFPYDQNTLVARFTALGSGFGTPVTFEVRMEGGATGGWVPVGSAGSTVLDRLKQGSYILHVRPRQGATIGQEDSVTFSVRAPWYRTPFAYFSYVVLGTAAILLTIWLSTLFERREMNRLERLIAARTRELQQTNRQLANQMDEIRVLTQAIAQSPVAVFITSVEGIIEYANPCACLLMGRTAQELAGADINLLRHEDNPQPVLDEIARTLASGESWTGQLTVRRVDGRPVPVRCTMSRITGLDGHTHNLILKEDITEWLESQERRRRLEAQLVQAQKLESIGTLAGGIAHDFNNILTGILGYCELARLNAEQRLDNSAELEQIRAAGRRAKDLVSQILTFSRKNQMTRIALDVRRPVEEALKLLRPSIPATIEFTQHLQSGIIEADASQIHQIVVNLCTNAIHAMADRPGKLAVDLEPAQVDEVLAAETPNLKSGHYMRLKVTDTGPGMDATTLERIFDPFFTTKPQGKGTGLGLPIVQGAIMSHGGAMRVRSQPGAGTTFELYFPVVSEPIAPSSPTLAAARGSGEEILIVDDEAFVAEFAEALLRRQGYVCVRFTDPRDALAAFRNAPDRFSILLTDLTMPHLTGLELIEQVRRVADSLPVIIITGYGDKQTREHIATLADCAMLQKPFSGDVLLHLVAEMIQRRTHTAQSDHR